MSKVTAIVLAAGSGSRMNSSTKKQFMELKGKPVIWYSLFAFEKSSIDQIILVTGEEDVEYCREKIIKQYGFDKVSDVVSGGSERYDSVYNGLKVSEGDIVLIHDGARPLINEEIISRCIDCAKKTGACVAGMPVKDTVKIVGDDNIIESTPDRKNIWITQTPQAFNGKMIKEAYENMKQSESANITDDAMVVENFTDNKVCFVEGSYENIKITTPEDISVAEVFLDKRK